MTIIAEILPYIQIGLSIILVTLALLQHSDSDLGSAFGSSDSSNSQAHTRRGAERTLHNATIVTTILFAASALIGLLA